jgi:ArsR family transcriptional regulator
MSAAIALEAPPQDQPLEALACTFKGLADPARLKILLFLAQPGKGVCCGPGDGVCACDLEAVTELSQPTVSHHMKCLISAGLVSAEKRGKWMYYQLDPKGFALLKNALAQILL